MEIIIETSAKHVVTKIIAPKDTFNILMTNQVVMVECYINHNCDFMN